MPEIFGQKVSENITIRNFNRPKILRYSKTTLVSRNKPSAIRQRLRMVGIVKAVTKELEPECSFKNSCRRLSHFELQSSHMEQTLGETILEIRNCFTEFVLFSHRYICKPLSVEKNYLLAGFISLTRVLYA